MKLKKLFVFLTVTIIVGLSTTNVFATTDLNSILRQENNIANEYSDIPDTGNYTITSGSNTNNTSNTNSPNTIAAAGLERPSIVFIVVCGISAVYAYKKIREYKSVN